MAVYRLWGPLLSASAGSRVLVQIMKLPLLTRKQRLKRILPSRSPHVLYVDHSRGNGTALYRLACPLDLEGIVAKRADSRYEDNPSAGNWINIKNRPTVKRKGGEICLSERGKEACDVLIAPAIDIHVRMF
jgi:ATP-dependent DNA ligase